MFGSAFFAVARGGGHRPPETGDRPRGTRPTGKGKPKAPKVKMMDRLEERWRRRREGDGR